MHSLSSLHESELRRLSAANHDLRLEVARAERELEAVQQKIDIENLKVSRMAAKMRKAKKGMKKVFAQDDQSYIEVTFP